MEWLGRTIWRVQKEHNSEEWESRNSNASIVIHNGHGSSKGNHETIQVGDKIEIKDDEGTVIEKRDQNKDYETVKRKFSEYFIPKKNTHHECFLFAQKVQQESITVTSADGKESKHKETVEKLLGALQTKVKKLSIMIKMI